MHRRVRDAAGTAAVLVVLFGVLWTISPLVRQRVAQFAGGGGDPTLVPRQVISQILTSTGATALRYAGNNTYLVVFLIVAGVLFILMLRT